jgi:hypothetical protein
MSGPHGRSEFKVGEVRFQIWVPLVEGVKVLDMVVVGFAEGDGESPVEAIMIVKEEDCRSAV